MVDLEAAVGAAADAGTVADVDAVADLAPGPAVAILRLACQSSWRRVQVLQREPRVRVPQSRQRVVRATIPLLGGGCYMG